MLTYYLAGLMYLNGVGRRVLIPDGSDERELPLAATILIAKDEWKGDTFGTAWRPREIEVNGGKKDFLEFILKKRSRVSLPHRGDVTYPNIETGLPLAQKARFVPNLETPDTIAEIEVGGGELSACMLGNKPIVKWTVDHKRGDVTINASLLDKDRNPTSNKQTLTVSGNATVVFMHASNIYVAQNGTGAEAPYYKGARLYSKIGIGTVDPYLFEANRYPDIPGDPIPDGTHPHGLTKLPDFDTTDPIWGF